MKNYQVYIFDWDGCLARTLDLWLVAYKQVFASYGIFPPEEEISKKAFGASEGPLLFGVEDIEKFYQQMNRVIADKLPTVDLYSQAAALLENLVGKDKPLAVVSSNWRASVLAGLEHNQIDQYISKVVAQEDVAWPKPDPEGINTILQAYEIAPEEVVIVGDSDKDILAAQAAGVDSILYFPEDHHRFYDKQEFIDLGPTRVIESFGELL